MNRLMPWLPVLLALSTSSPFWERCPTGLMSYRQAAYDEWPRTGIPDFFADQAEYDRFAALLVSQGAIADASYLWWAIRPSLAHPTLELRICDSCTRVEDTLALAALYRCLVHAHLADPGLGQVPGPMTRRLVEENRWRAKRWGTAAEWVMEAGDRAVGFGERLEQLLGLVAGSARLLDCEPELAQVRRIAATGTSAHGQLAVYQARCQAGDNPIAALRAVVDWLIATTLVPASP
jgi:carboxylate-amine ligase